MIDDAIGYRAASITDACTGTSRLSKPNYERLKKAATLVLRADAYKRLKQGEQAIGDRPR